MDWRNISVGARVRVAINPSRYASGAAEALDAHVGTVEFVNAEPDGLYVSGPYKGQRNYDERLAFVRFDTPADPWSKYQHRCAGFWFGPEELQPTGDV